LEAYSYMAQQGHVGKICIKFSPLDVVHKWSLVICIWSKLAIFASEHPSN
jgi:hypothetical protein